MKTQHKEGKLSACACGKFSQILEAMRVRLQGERETPLFFLTGRDTTQGSYKLESCVAFDLLFGY